MRDAYFSLATRGYGFSTLAPPGRMSVADRSLSSLEVGQSLRAPIKPRIIANEEVGYVVVHYRCSPNFEKNVSSKGFPHASASLINAAQKATFSR